MIQSGGSRRPSRAKVSLTRSLVSVSICSAASRSPGEATVSNTPTVGQRDAIRRWVRARTGVTGTVAGSRPDATPAIEIPPDGVEVVDAAAEHTGERRLACERPV